ncbi:hypothetical protein NIES2101_32340 [Calothrix sp. HK-06]|nr:hypothetical protein NIES2101_32340 [Calothrix sp. HK-06]
MPRSTSKPVWGRTGNPGPGFYYDFEIPSGSEDFIVDSAGKANIPVRIYNDKMSDGDNIIALTVDTSTVGFNQEIYEFQEKNGLELANDGSPIYSSDQTFPIGLNTTSTTQTAYVLIYDDENPSRKTKGDNSANNINLKGASNNDTSNDTVLAGAGDDIVDTGKGNDIVFGQQGNDKIWGREGNDYLFGGDGNDYLNGGDGKDYIDGGAGADTMEGGNGDDTYIVDNVNDKIIDSPGTGVETVNSSVNWILGAGLDNLYLIGNATQGIGNNLNNNIYGNSQNNTLEGKEGNDKLEGGEGNDYLNGGDGNDILDGGYGADTLEGGYGDDIYIVNDVNDKIIDSSGTGIETVKAFVDWTLGAGLDNLILEGYGKHNGTGNNLNNTITGNQYDNILYGGAGNDILSGKGGNDTLIGGSGADTFVFESLTANYFPANTYQEGIDSITDFNWAEGDKIQISKSGFGATSTSQFSYNSSTGALYFDASPSDSIAAIQFATLTPGTSFIPGSDIKLV